MGGSTMTTFTTEQVNVPASATTTNLLSGDLTEFMPVLSEVNVWAVASAANVNMILLADSDVVINDQEITSIGTSINNVDHLIATFLAAAQTRLSLKLRETAGTGTQDVLIKLTVEPA